MWSSMKRAATGRLFGSRLACSFCGRRADEVSRLVAGASAHICDACIRECVAVLGEHGGFDEPSGLARH